MNPYGMILPWKGNTFEEQLNSLSQQLTSALGGCQNYHLVYAKIFLSDIRNQYDALISSQWYKEQFGGIPVSIVGQPPLGGKKIAILYRLSKAPFEEYRFQPYRLTAEEATTATDSYQQTLTLFNRYIDDIASQGLDIATHLVRTWIYVDDIDRHYAGVVRARNEVFARHGLTADTHFIASTGIGGATQHVNSLVAIDFLTYPDIKEEDKYYLQAPEKIGPTHQYGVTFERGVRLTTPLDTRYFISGTASIDNKGNVVHKGDVIDQLQRLLENIEALLSDGGAKMSDIAYLLVYLRDNADHDLVINYLRCCFSDRLPILIVEAKVCRPEWLIEVEAIAHKAK